MKDMVVEYILALIYALCALSIITIVFRHFLGENSDIKALMEVWLNMMV